MRQDFILGVEQVNRRDTRNLQVIHKRGNEDLYLTFVSDEMTYVMQCAVMSGEFASEGMN